MAKTIPLIRAANLLPLVRFTETHGRNTAQLLDEADLAYWFHLSPIDPIPLRNGLDVMRALSRTYGPDIGPQIVTQASLPELGYIGQVALGARSPAEALMRVSRALPFHSSHEHIGLDQKDGMFVLTQRFDFDIDDEALHAVHGLFTALLQTICAFNGTRPPAHVRVQMVPHPTHGLAHLQPHFGPSLTTAPDKVLRIELTPNVLGAPFRSTARDRLPQLMALQVPPLAEDASLAASVRAVLGSMIHDGAPKIDRVARSAGTSVRSLQRRLSEEGTSFGTELQTVRRRIAEDLLTRGEIRVGDVAERLGYAQQSAFTRAVRRWTGKPPSFAEKAAKRAS